MVDVTTANKVLSSDLFVYTYFWNYLCFYMRPAAGKKRIRMYLKNRTQTNNFQIFFHAHLEQVDLLKRYIFLKQNLFEPNTMTTSTMYNTSNIT